MIRNLTTLLNNLRTHNNEFKEVSGLIRYASNDFIPGATITFNKGRYQGKDATIISYNPNTNILEVSLSFYNHKIIKNIDLNVERENIEVLSSPVINNESENESIMDYIHSHLQEESLSLEIFVLEKFAPKLDQMNDKEIKVFEDTLIKCKNRLYKSELHSLFNIFKYAPEYISILKPDEVISLFRKIIYLHFIQNQPEYSPDLFSEEFLIQNFEKLDSENKFNFCDYLYGYIFRANQGIFNKLYQLYPNLIDMITFALIEANPQSFYDLDINKLYTEQPYVPGQEHLNTPKLDEENIIKLIAKKNPTYFLQNNLINKIDRHDPERYNIEYQAAFNAISLPDKEIIYNIEYLYNPNFENKYPLLFEKLKQKILNMSVYDFSIIKTFHYEFLKSPDGIDLFELYINNLFNQEKYYEIFKVLMLESNTKNLFFDSFYRLYKKLSEINPKKFKHIEAEFGRFFENPKLQYYL